MAVLLAFGLSSTAAPDAAAATLGDGGCQQGQYLAVNAWNDDNENGVGGKFTCGKFTGTAGAEAWVGCDEPDMPECQEISGETTQGSEYGTCKSSYGGESADHVSCSGTPDEANLLQAVQSLPAAHEWTELATYAASMTAENANTFWAQIDATEQRAFVCEDGACEDVEPTCYTLAPTETPRCTVEI